MEIDTDIAVIGAGLAGLTAAAALHEAGQRVVVVEKSRGTGGRLATRRIGGLRFDHGAQYIRTNDPDFAAALARLRAAGAAAPWEAVAGGGALVGLPGMSGLVKPLAAGLDLHTGVEVATATRGPEGWTLADGTGQAIARAGTLVSAIPAPQARGLLADLPLSGALDAVRFAPNWTLMAAFDTPLDLPETVRDAQADLSWIARDAGKPGRASAPETWVAQAGAAWSAAHLEEDRETACAGLLALLAARTSAPLPDPVHASAHRWRYAQAEVPLGAPCLADPGARVAIAGDWCLGARAEHAWRSGQAAADAVLAFA